MGSENKIQDINRRKFLRQFGKAIGGTAFGATMSAVMLDKAFAYERKPGSEQKQGKVFSQSQMQTLKQICAQVLPATNTPGAHQVDTHGFIDNQLYNCFTEKVRSEHVKLLNLLERKIQKRHGNSFIDCSESQQHALLLDIDSARGEFNQEQRKSFKQLKSLIAFGYYTSEVGMTEELRYDPIPGGYTGEVAYKTGEGAWAN